MIRFLFLTIILTVTNLQPSLSSSLNLFIPQYYISFTNNKPPLLRGGFINLIFVVVLFLNELDAF